MTVRSKRLDLDSVVPGMELAVSLLDRHGAILLPEATILTSEILTSLGRRGIDELIVVDSEMSEQELEAERRRVMARLDRLFRRCHEEGGCMVLKRAVLGYRLGSEA